MSLSRRVSHLERMSANALTRFHKHSLTANKTQSLIEPLIIQNYGGGRRGLEGPVGLLGRGSRRPGPPAPGRGQKASTGFQKAPGALGPQARERPFPPAQSPRRQRGNSAAGSHPGRRGAPQGRSHLLREHSGAGLGRGGAAICSAASAAARSGSPLPSASPGRGRGTGGRAGHPRGLPQGCGPRAVWQGVRHQ